MTHHKLFNLLAIVALLVPLATFTSCSDNPDEPSYSYDPRLIGSWQLTEADGQSVSGDQANFYTFVNEGKGIYYYYSNGTLESTPISWECTLNGSGGTMLFISTQGALNGMRYTVAGSSLTLSWSEMGATHSYTYTKIESIPAD